jgi:hypothetical protein
MRRRALASPTVLPIPPATDNRAMNRIKSRSVRFADAFVLTGLDGEQPPGIYEVETEEALLPGISFPVYRRIETRIIIPFCEMGARGHQTVPVDPDELEAALARDAARTRRI